MAKQKRRADVVDRLIILIRKVETAAMPLERLVWRLLGIYVLLRHHPW